MPSSLVVVVWLALTISATGAQTVPKKTVGNPVAPAVAQAQRVPTQEDLAQVVAIKSDVVAIEKQIGEAQVESDQLARGPITARIGARIAQMRYTVSLLQT